MTFLIPDHVLEKHNSMTKEECSSFDYQQDLLSTLGFSIVATSEEDDYLGQLWAHPAGFFIYSAKNPPQNTPSFSLHFINRLSLKEDQKPNHIIQAQHIETRCKAIFSNDNEPWHADVGAFLFSRMGDNNSMLNSQNFLSFLSIMLPILDIRALNCLDEEMVKLALFPLTDTDSHNLPKIFVDHVQTQSGCSRLIPEEFLAYAFKQINPIETDLDILKKYDASFQILDAKKFYSIGYALRASNVKNGCNEFSFEDRKEIKNFFAKALTGIQTCEYSDLFDTQLMGHSGFDLVMQIALLQISLGASSKKIKQLFEYEDPSYIQRFMEQPEIKNPYFTSPPALQSLSLFARAINTRTSLDGGRQAILEFTKLIRREDINIQNWCWENSTINLPGEVFEILYYPHEYSSAIFQNKEEKHNQAQLEILQILAILKEEKLFSFYTPVVLSQNPRWFETILDALPENSLQRSKIKSHLMDGLTPFTLIDLYPCIQHSAKSNSRINKLLCNSIENQLLAVILSNNVKKISRPEKPPGLTPRF